MVKRERYKRLIMFIASAMVIGIQTLNFAYVWFNYYNFRSVIGSTYWRRGHWAIIALYAVISLLMSNLFGALKVGYLRVLDVIISQILAVILSNTIFYIQLALIGRWKFLANILPMLGLTLVNLCVVIIWVVFARWIYTSIYPPRSVVLIHDTKDPDRFRKKLSARKDKYVIKETIRLDKGLDHIMSRIDECQGVILGDLPSHERNILVKYCFDRNIRCYCSPKISDIMLMSSEKVHMFDTPLLLMRNRGLTVEQQFVKRAFDLVVSLVGMILLSPLFLIIALAIKLYDRGPVIYKQERYTKDERVFMIYKFRSMVMDSEKEGARLARKNDSRITPVGRILRNIHFDELPQLINIIKGDMSVVGPRPERPQIAEEYERDMPEFKYRLKVKAGLTGYAQIYGKYNTTPYDKLKLDLTYIENYSFLLDLQLIASTVKILFQKENTEGVEEWQKTASLKEGKDPK